MHDCVLQLSPVTLTPVTLTPVPKLHPAFPLIAFVLVTGGYGRPPSSCTSVPSSSHFSKRKSWEGIEQKAQERQRVPEVQQYQVIIVTHSKLFIVLPRQAHPCPALFFNQNLFLQFYLLFSSARWSQPLPLEKAWVARHGPVTPCLTLMAIARTVERSKG